MFCPAASGHMRVGLRFRPGAVILRPATFGEIRGRCVGRALDELGQPSRLQEGQFDLDALAGQTSAEMLWSHFGYCSWPVPRKFSSLAAPGE
jgi:hypothetical protein